MPVKSIIDIDINDQAFRGFHNLFQKYQTALAQQPQKWQAANVQIRNAQQGVNAIVGAIAAQTAVLANVAAQHGTIANQAGAAARAWQQISAQVKSVVGPIGAITRHILSWSTVTGAVSGLLGLGGLWGLSRMSADVTEGRRSSSGLGVTYGQEKAFNLQMGRFVDPGFLGRISHGLQLGSEAYPGLVSAGVTSSDPYEASRQLIESLTKGRLSQFLGKNPNSQLIQSMLQGFGLQGTLNLEEVKRLIARPGEAITQLGRTTEGANRLNLTEKEQRGWNDLTTQLSNAALGIETTFVRGLLPLATPIKNLSDAVEQTVQKFLKAAKNEGWIDKFASGIEYVADKMLSPEFQKGVSDLISRITDMSSAMSSFVDRWFSKTEPESVAAAKTMMEEGTHPITLKESLMKPGGGGAKDYFLGVRVPNRKTSETKDSTTNYLGGVSSANVDDYYESPAILADKNKGLAASLEAALMKYGQSRISVSVEPGSSVNAAVETVSAGSVPQ